MALFRDIFYPGNPERRDKIVRKYQSVLNCMQDNFYAFNQLADYMKRNFDGNSAVGRVVHPYNELQLKEDDTIKNNCDMFVREAEKLQNAVSILDRELGEKLDPVAYRCLKDTNIGFKEVIRQLSQWGSVFNYIGATVAVVVAVYRIISGAMLTALVEELSLVAACSIAGVGIFAVAVPIDMIMSAILGAIERQKLEKAIEELDATLATLEPATRAFTHNVCKVLAGVQSM